MLMVIQPVCQLMAPRKNGAFNFNAVLLASAACLWGVSTSAAAQTAEAVSAEARQTIAEIVVSATRRDTDLQSTPISISALTSDTIRSSNILDVRGLAAQVPGLSITGDNQLGTSPISIRGIGSAGGGVGADDPVAIYVDDVYLGRPSSSTFALIDVERVEVLRGPQGSLFGRNATGGALRFVTKRPSFDATEGFFTAGYGRFNAINAGGYVTGPIADTLAFKVSGNFSDRDGYAVNIFRGTPEVPYTGPAKPLGERSTTVRAALSYQREGVSLDLNADYGTLNQNVPFKDVRPFLQGVSPDLNPEAAPDVYSNNQPIRQDRNFGGVGLNAKIELGGWAELSSITAYRESYFSEIYDSDASAADILGLEPTEDQKQFSQEIRISSVGDSPFQWVVGAYYFFEDSEQNLFFRRGPGLPGATRILSTNKTNSYAGFFDASYQLTDKLKLSSGLRYTEETKDFSLIAGSRFSALPQAPRARNEFSAFTPRFALEYQASDDIYLYASASRGFKSGGFNLTSLQSFDPETIWSYESGLKAEWLDRRVRTNISAFYYDYTNLQVRISVAPGQTAVLNAADARIYGLEFEGTALVGENLKLETNFAYLNAKYKNFLSPVFDASGAVVSNINFSNNRLNRAPEWKAFVAADYTVPFGGDVNLTLRGEYSFESRLFFTRQNDPNFGRRPVHLFNLRARLDVNDKLNFTVFGENLTNERFVANAVEIGVRPLGYIALPRTFGIAASYRY